MGRWSLNRCHRASDATAPTTIPKRNGVAVNLVEVVTGRAMLVGGWAAFALLGTPTVCAEQDDQFGDDKYSTPLICR
jgi:hypothetical protein